MAEGLDGDQIKKLDELLVGELGLVQSGIRHEAVYQNQGRFAVFYGGSDAVTACCGKVS